ncbi:MAG: 50S ribosomal protein L4 [Deltaproteobacteria bacterium]|nr:50S ribosomal protein L4 [Deltaproteobacteria bacterium]MBI5810426.1 50S ribosomal protein L4 [Deltaproteobacteria bacterium]
MTVDVLNKDGVKVSQMEIARGLAEGEVKERLFYETVKMQMANRRSGTASTKTRAFVSGGGAKPWKQKGTGRARAGSNRSPVWRHGGTVFGPHPRDYSYSIPKKVRKDAIKSALILKLKDGRLRIFDSIVLSEPRTKAAIGIFKKANIESALVVIDGGNRNLQLAVRNLMDFKVIEAGGINVYDVLNYKDLVMTKAAFEKVEAMIG